MSDDINYYNIEKNLQIAINNGKIIRLISYAMSDDIEQKLDQVISSLLETYGHSDKKGMIYTSVKELAINGTKANLKRIFFEEQGLNIHDEEQYEKGIKLYKETMVEEKAIEYGKIAKRRGLYVRISFFHEKDGLRIEVINNTAITKQEEKRLREKMGTIMQYDSLVDFYAENPDPTEGAGMGLALVTTMMRAEEIDPNWFRIITLKDKTIARMEIPFTSNYISLREKGK